jgi:hypothetical protein
MKIILLYFCFTISILAQSNNGEIKYVQIINNYKINSVLYFNSDESIYKKNILTESKEIDLNIEENKNTINLHFNPTKNSPTALGLFTSLKKKHHSRKYLFA